MFESFEKRRTSGRVPLVAILVSVAGVGIALLTILLVLSSATRSKPDGAKPARPTLPPPGRAQLPGMSLDISGNAPLVGDYLAGSVQQREPLEWAVSWQRGELLPAHTLDKLVDGVMRAAKAQRGQDLRVAGSRDLVVGGLPGRQYELVAPTGQAALVTFVACGGRFVRIMSAASGAQRPLATRMVESFRCTPDPDQELDFDEVAVEVRPGWQHTPTANGTTLVDHRGVRVRLSALPRLTNEPFEAYLSAALRERGVTLVSNDPQQIAERTLWHGSIEASPAAFVAWPCPHQPRIALVQVMSPPGTPLDAGIDLALTGRCLDPDEGPPAYPVLGEQPTTGGPVSCPPEMVRIPAGTFQMGTPQGDGDEQPHSVTLSGYCIDRTEVTVNAYEQCVEAKVCSAADWEIDRDCAPAGRSDHPVACVGWRQAAAYCKWAGKRLPTEAEWEYAARGDDGRTYPWGNEAPSAGLLNVCDRECGAMAKRKQRPWKTLYDDSDGWEGTAPVGSFPKGASPFGLLDMAGNVWEWTADWYGPYPRAARTNPRGMKTGERRVLRGGAWNQPKVAPLRSTYRMHMDPSKYDSDIGFRCARGA